MNKQQKRRLHLLHADLVYQTARSIIGAGEVREVGVALNCPNCDERTLQPLEGEANAYHCPQCGYGERR